MCSLLVQQVTVELSANAAKTQHEFYATTPNRLFRPADCNAQKSVKRQYSANTPLLTMTRLSTQLLSIQPLNQNLY